ncbi:hypothetical protein RN001_011170 [Aquatica leii]|uniref:Uncharacterized protein n=1 Tax=Aquatica leii TaxID=1421715 RepID=A0AAN7P7P4_9COLE|nr:hypothetical protein RN001_011170 [Aquatica leii]
MVRRSKNKYELINLLLGLPEFNVPRIDPIDVESLVIGEGTGAVHLTQNYKNVKIYGLTTSVIESVEFKGNDGDITLVTIGKVPELRLEADYDINGKILVMPVVGEGKCTIKLEEVNTTMTIKAKPFHKKGVTYSSIEEFLVTMAPKKMETIFENLFDGDAAMGAEMNKLINDNWVEVFSDVKNGYEEAFGLIFKNVANQIFKKVAFNDMFPL